MPRPKRRALEAMACHQHHAADAGRSRGTAGFGDTLDAERGGFRRSRTFLKDVDAWHVGVEQIEIGEVFRQQSRIGEAGKLVLRRGVRHGDRALRQRVDPVAFQIVGGNRRLLPADENAQTDIVALGALRFLDRAVAHLDRKRHRTHGDCIGLTGAGAVRGGNETAGEIGKRGLIEQR